MAIITSIRPQKSGKRVNIYLDGKFGFGMGLQTFLKEGLKVEQELTESQIESIVKKGEFQDSYDKILMFAAIRPRSQKEYMVWLKKHGVHESLHKELFNRLKHLQLLDDKKFAIWWVDQRQTFRPKSKRVLTLELGTKGVESDIIKEVLSEEEIDEKLAARRVLSKKVSKWEGLGVFERRKKIFGFLMQRGFGQDVIREILDEFGVD